MSSRRCSTFQLAACFLLLLASASGWAKVYRCQDAAGQTVFSSFPCGDGAERLEVRVGSGDAPGPRVPVEPANSPAASAVPDDPNTTVVPANAQAAADGTLSVEQQAYLEQAQELQRQAEQRQLELLRAQEQLEGQGYSTAYSSSMSNGFAGNRSGVRSAVDEAACARAEASLESLREQGRRGYSASESRSHRSRVREAKDRVRERCRPR